MRRYCKNIDITSYETVMPWVLDCTMRHKKRYDFKKLFLTHGMANESYAEFIKTNDKTLIEPIIKNITIDACERIKNRSLNLEPVEIRTMKDRTTGKIRQIGKESAMQQVFDYIAVYSAMDIFKARLVLEQASSIPNRGQVYGKNKIKRWIDSDNDAARYAERHGYHYSKKARYFCKLDIEKCYPSANTDVFLELFEKDCGNIDILWLWSELIHSHRVNGYTGFMIGALPSQWACQYMVSYVYRYAKAQGRQRRGEHVNSVKHMLIFMDDMLFIGSNRNQLKKAIERTIAYTHGELGWVINPNWHIRDINLFSIDMMGYVIHADGHVTIRSRDFVRLRRMFLRCHDRMNCQQAQRIMSYKGFIVHSDSKNVIKKYKARSVWRMASAIISDHNKEENNENSILTEAEQNRLQNAV